MNCVVNDLLKLASSGLFSFAGDNSKFVMTIDDKQHMETLNPSLTLILKRRITRTRMISETGSTDTIVKMIPITTTGDKRIVLRIRSLRSCRTLSDV